jgi:acetyltransferase-like isoleucine patch superfamily enzyme
LKRSASAAFEPAALTDEFKVFIFRHCRVTQPASPIPTFMPGQFCLIAPDVKLGQDVLIYNFVNLYGCEIGDGTRIGSFVEIQKGAVVGRNCKVSSHSFICEGVTIADEVFIGHGVIFINDKYPRATTADGSLQSEADWQVVKTVVERGASIGSGATILCGVTIGEEAIIGAGALVTKDVPARTSVAGNPARALVRQGE